jgi:fatty acid-binding protein DegV
MHTLRERLFLVNLRIQTTEEELEHMKKVRDRLIKQIEETEAKQPQTSEPQVQLFATQPSEEIREQGGFRRCKTCEI